MTLVALLIVPERIRIIGSVRILWILFGHMDLKGGFLWLK